jgi:hypothetical protein
MKLSQIKGDRVIEVVADIIDPISNIATDKKASELFKRVKLPEGADPKEFVVSRIRKSAPYLLKEHKSDIVAILAAVAGESYEAYAEKLTLVKLLEDFTELLNDEDFKALFFSAQSVNASGSASENIADRAL